MSKQEEWISLSEAVELLKTGHFGAFTRAHLARCARNGTLAARKVGKMWLTTKQSVIWWYYSTDHVPGVKPKTPSK